MSEHRRVRHDPATGASPLFRPLPARKSELRQKLDVRMTHGGVELHWRGPDALGIPEETLLLAILEKLSDDHAHFKTSAVLAPDTNTDLGKSLWAGLAIQGKELAGETLVLFTSFAALCRACGHDTGGAAIEQVKTMLRRLVEVTLWVRHDGLESSSRLLSWLVSDAQQVVIAINRRLALAIRGSHFCKVNLAERFMLPNHTAQALHGRLSAQIREGRSMRYRLDSLERMVWGAQAAGSTQRNRFAKLRAALTALDDLPSWQVSSYLDKESKTVFHVQRLAAHGKAELTARKSSDVSSEKR